MLKYLVVSDEDRVVDYLGVFEAAVEREFSEEDAAWFERSKGVKLLQGNVPEGVKVTIIAIPEEEEEN